MGSSSTTPPRWRYALLALLAVGCSKAERAGQFEANGELIALSGGDAGARGACVTCHGLHGEGNGGDAPRLAGLDAGYIVRQLEYYATGQRQHPQMVWIADHLERPARVRLGAYYAALPVPEDTSAKPSTAPACDRAIARLYHEGERKRGIQACADCHGDDGRGVGAGNPPLAGQPPPYLAEQLRQWRNGRRYGDPLRVMLDVSRRLSEEELESLARYSAALQGAGAYPELPAACLPGRRRGSRNGA